MSSWTGGYVAEINYTHGYYRELSPQLLAFAALSRGLRAPDVEGPLTYCELGCGQGFSANILAAANPNVEIYAMDFNPAQIAGARFLAEAADLRNIHFSDDSFEEYLRDDSLPQFDFITLHGIYSWVSEENRRYIVEFIRKKLKVGGFVYISYNTLPGWAPGMPLRRLFVEHAGTTGGPLPSRIEKALMFADRLKHANVGYFQHYPATGKRLESIHSQNRNYVAHEYFNKDWTPFYFSDVVRELEDGKVGYVGSAHLLDHIDGLNVTPDHLNLLNEIADPVFKETARDYFTLQQFRRDIFARGPLAMNQLEANDAWLNVRLALTTPRDKVQLKVQGPLGDMNLQPEVYEPLLDALAKGPKTVRQLGDDPAVRALGWPRIVEGVKVLVGANNVQPCLDAKGEAKRAQRAKAFNEVVKRRALVSNEMVYLASPVLGSGVAVDRFHLMFALASKEKDADAPLLVWKQLEQLGQKLLKDGKMLQTEEENLAELRSRYEAFPAQQEMWKQLGVA